MKCFKCGAEVSDEEMRQRYNELLRMGIVATMIAMCQDCRNGKEISESTKTPKD